MMIFTSIYSVVDGLFVSNFVGKTAFASVNLIMPFIMILGAIGFMLGTGGNAIVSKTLGEGEPKLAQKYFSMIIYCTMIGGVIVSILVSFSCQQLQNYWGPAVKCWQEVFSTDVSP